MHWPAKRPEPRPDYHGKRTVRRFAWWPTLVDLDDDPPMRVWLEHYYEDQEPASDGYYGLVWRGVRKYSLLPF